MGSFIIAIVLFFILRFLFDTWQQSRKIKSEGGLRKKYAILVDYILSCDSKSKIFQETNTFISVGVSGLGGSQIFNICPTYGNVTIQMVIKNNPVFGNQKMEWTFPEEMNQEHMIMKINSDIETKFKSIMREY